MPEEATMERLNDLQLRRLLTPIDPARVKSRDGQAYIPQQDVRAQLTRIFGFGGWDMEVTDQHLVYEGTQPSSKDASKIHHVACYRSTVRLTVKDLQGQVLGVYEDTNLSESAPQPNRGAAHSLAVTTSVSTALKRAASCLGDQFGLSLYNKGQRAGFVMWSLPHEMRLLPSGDVEKVSATQAPALETPKVEDEHDPDLPQAEDHETVTEQAAPARRTTKKATAAPPQEPQEPAGADNAQVDGFLARLDAAADLEDVQERLQATTAVLTEILKAGVKDELVRFRDQSMTLRAAVDVARGEMS
jgi:hypothetical protein